MSTLNGIGKFINLFIGIEVCYFLYSPVRPKLDVKINTLNTQLTYRQTSMSVL